MHTTEHQQIELKAALGQSSVTLRRDDSGEAIGIRIAPANRPPVTAIVNPAEFLLAARTLCEAESAAPPGSTPMARVLAKIAAERERQNLLVDAGKIPWNCASPLVQLGDKNGVWAEKVLKAHSEFLAFANSGLAVERHEIKQRLRAELVQVAAVTVAILESLEGVS